MRALGCSLLGTPWGQFPGLPRGAGPSNPAKAGQAGRGPLLWGGSVTVWSVAVPLSVPGPIFKACGFRLCPFLGLEQPARLWCGSLPRQGLCVL